MSTVEELAGESFDEAVSRHAGILYAVAVRQVGQSHAADVVQETLLRAWSRRSSYDASRGSLRSWLVALLLDQSRRYRVRHLGRSFAVSLDYGHADPDSARRIDVDRAVRALPRRQRQVVTLYYLADLSVSDTAAALGISVPAAKAALHDARLALRLTLEP